MADDTERLIVLLEARLTDFERNMLKASGVSQKNFNQIKKQSRSATRQMEQDMQRSTSRINQALASTSTRIGAFGASLKGNFFGGLVGGATAALAPILSVAGALVKARQALSEFSKTADVSARLGVPAEKLQELRFAAEQSGMAVDNFDVAFRRFIRRSAEAAQGTGAAKDAFKELGISVRDADGNLKASDKLLGEVADRLQKVKDPADKLRLAFKLFDTDGAAMVNVLANGSRGLDDFAQKARNLGIIVDEHLIRRSAELQTELETATRIMDLQFKQALVNLAPVLVGIAERAARLAGDIRSVIDAMRDLEGQSTQSLDGKMRSLGLETLEVEGKLLRARRALEDFVGPEARRGHLQNVVATLENRLKEINEEEAKILAILNGRKPVQATPIPEGEAIDTSRSQESRDKAAQAAIREAEAVKELIAQLQFERDQIGLTDLEKKTNEALRRAGAAATKDQRDEIRGLVAEIERETEALKKNEEVQKARANAIDNLFQMGSDAIMSIVDKSATAEEAVKKLAIQLALAAAQAALFNSGPLAGLFNFGGGSSFVPNTTAGAFFTNGFSSGTANTGGQKGQPRGVVHGQEAVIPLPSGGKVPVQVQGGGQAMAGETRVKVDVGVSVDKDGNLQAFVRNVSQETAASTMQRGLQDYDREVAPQTVSRVLSDPYARG